MWRTRARRTAARAIVSRPAYRAFVQVPATAPLVARAAFRTGRDDILRRALDRLQRRTPVAASTHLLRADLLTFEGRYDEALAAAADAADAAGADTSAAAAARVVKLTYRVAPGPRSDEATASAVGRFPRSVEVLWQAAMACDNAGTYDRIAGAWSASADPAVDLPRVVRQLSSAAARAGRLDDAADWYRRAATAVLAATTPPPRPATTRLAGLGGPLALRDICTTLDTAGVPYFFVAGTALGLVREGRPLGTDNDIDVGVYDADWDRAALIDLFTRHPRFDLDLHPQTQRVGLRHRGGAPVDIFRFYPQDGQIWHDGVFVRWGNSPFEVVRRRIGGLEVPLPADSDRYLTENYGDGWRTPWPGFDAFTDDAPNVEVTWPEYHRLHLLRRGYERLAVGDRAAAARELARAGEPDLAATVAADPPTA
jgi:hypothetical protein